LSKLTVITKKWSWICRKGLSKCTFKWVIRFHSQFLVTKKSC
jgi:hypothetical protein